MKPEDAELAASLALFAMDIRRLIHTAERLNEHAAKSHLEYAAAAAEQGYRMHAARAEDRGPLKEV